MPKAKEIGETFGDWTCVKVSRYSVVLRCVCGTEKTEHRGTWRNRLHLSRICRRCLIKRANKRMEQWLFTRSDAVRTKQREA